MSRSARREQNFGRAIEGSGGVIVFGHIDFRADENLIFAGNISTSAAEDLQPAICKMSFYSFSMRLDKDINPKGAAMSYATLMVYVDADHLPEQRVRLSAGLADKFSATLIGLSALAIRH